VWHPKPPGLPEALAKGNGEGWRDNLVPSKYNKTQVNV